MTLPLLPAALARVAAAAIAPVIAPVFFLAACASTHPSTTLNDPASSPGAVYAPETLAPGRYALVVLGMSCPKCISNVDLQLARIDGLRDAKVDMRHGLVTFSVPGPTQPSRAAVSQAILDAGFTLREIRRIDAEGGAS